MTITNSQGTRQSGSTAGAMSAPATIQGFEFREALRLGYGDSGSVGSGLSGALVGERNE